MQGRDVMCTYRSLWLFPGKWVLKGKNEQEIWSSIDNHNGSFYYNGSQGNRGYIKDLI